MPGGNSSMADSHQNSNEQDENKLIGQRREKLTQLRQKGEAFPNDFRRDSLAQELQTQWADYDKASLEEKQPAVTVAGRIIRMRGPFIVIQDGSGQMQLYVAHKALSEEANAAIKQWDLGDIIGVSGELFRTGKGELTVWIRNFQLLTKSLRPLPDKHKGLTDTEIRYRQRYVDLIANEESRQL